MDSFGIERFSNSRASQKDSGDKLGCCLGCVQVYFKWKRLGFKDILSEFFLK